MDNLKILGKILFLLLVSEALADDVHLPTHLTPYKYSLDLVLDPRATTYDGLVEITFSDTDTKINTIQLHASSETIEIQDALLNFEYSCNVTNADSDTDVVTLTCPKDSLEKQNTLIINFKGTYSVNDMKGLYKSTYMEDGVEYVLLATQFEPVAARRAFPCFDEPSLKATFDIFITHPNDYSALSNTASKKTFQIGPDNIQTQFETTPSMSTYLVAFIVSKFVSNSDGKTRDYDDQIFSRPSAKEFTSVAATYAPALIDLLSEWTGINYEDLGNTQAYQVAIPDFAPGAMENWGLITFREVDLLDDKNNTSNAAKQRIITTIAHELAHQWFGDYVTLDWWSDTWLNEGFATYFQYLISDQLDDNLDTMRQFIVNELQAVLQADAIPSALPLTSDVNSAAEVSNKFDDVSYSKGASIIWMLRNIITEDTFQKGLNSYLKTFKYGNSNPTNLLNSFNASTPDKLGLNKIMDNWIHKSGFPLVTANLNGSTVVLTQERFLFQNDSEAEATQWYIPISYTTGADKEFIYELSDWLKPNSTVEVELNDTWILINVYQTGYYRVNYEHELWHRIITVLESNKDYIDVLNRAQLIDDMFNIARAGKISYDMVFHLAGYLESETAYYPWVSAFNALSYIFGKLNDAEAEKLLQEEVLSWINKAFPANSTDTGKEHVDKLKEVLIQDWGCKLGQEECIKYVNETFQSYKENKSLPDYNKRGLVFCHGFRISAKPEEDYKVLLDIFKDSTSVVEQNEIISALGCSENSEILTKYLSEAISSNSSIRKQDAIYVFRAVYTHSAVGVNVTLNFLENNAKNITDRFSGMSLLSNVIFALADKVASDEQIKQLTKIITDNSDNEGVKLISQRVTEITTANKNWRDAHAADIKKILNANKNAAHIPQPVTLLLVIAFTLLYIFSGKY